MLIPDQDFLELCARVDALAEKCEHELDIAWAHTDKPDCDRVDEETDDSNL